MAVLQSQLRLTLHDQVSGRMKAISAQMAAFQTRMRAMTAPFMGMTARLAAVGGGYLAATRGIGGTVGAAIGFESAMADVAKVLDVTDEQFGNVRRQIIGLSKVLPNSAEGIADIYAAAAQSNIPMAELGKFTEMVAKISVAWDVAEGETSQALAEIKNQLHLSVDDIGLYADAINHLSNNTAARAPDLVDFSKRVAAQGEMFGFAAAESLAFGGAMIASGAQTNVAATSFRNMGMALADAAKAPKAAQAEFKKLGLNTKKLAKEFNTDAVGTMMDVFERIQALPEHERLSTAIGVFGSEARALMPLINDSKELRRQLELVGDKTKYAGSAFKEYMERADTTSNVLAIMRNRIRAIGIEMGTKWLPTIKEVAIAFSDVFDTMGDRVTPFKRMETAIKGFMQGLGYDGSIKEVVDDLADLFFGKIDPSEGADKLGQLFIKMKGWGEAVREFSDAIRDNPVAKFVADIAGEGFKLMLAATGIGLLAGAVGKLGRAMWMLSGAGLAVGIIKSVAGLGGAMLGLPGLGGNGKAPKPGLKAPKGAPGGAATGGVVATILRQIATRVPQIAAGVMGAYGAQQFISETSADNAAEARRLATPRDAERDSMDALARQRSDLDEMREERNAKPDKPVGFFNSPAWGHVEDAGASITNGLNAVGSWLLDWDRRMSESFPSLSTPGAGDGASLVPEIQSLRDAIHQPSGTQQVREVNRQIPNINLGGVTVYATTNASPQDIANATAARISAALESQFSNASLA